MASALPHDGNYLDDQSSYLLETIWSLTAVSCLLIGVRMYTQIAVVGHVNMSDYLMLLALASAFTNTGLITVGTTWGLGRHYWALDSLHQTMAMKYEFLAEPWGILSPLFARVSFVCFMLNLVGSHRKYKIILYVTNVSQIIVNGLTILLILIQCQHIETLWDHSVQGRCWSTKVQTYSGFFQGAWNSSTDLVLTVLPIVLLWNLKMKRSLKIILVCLLSLSIFAMVASIIKTYYLQYIGQREDFTYDTVPFIVWFTVENNIVMTIASIPVIRPLYIRIRKRMGDGDSYDINPNRPRTDYRKRAKKNSNNTTDLFSETKDLQTTLTGFTGGATDSRDEETQTATQDAPTDRITKTTRVTVRYGGSGDSQTLSSSTRNSSLGMSAPFGQGQQAASNL